MAWHGMALPSPAGALFRGSRLHVSYFLLVGEQREVVIGGVCCVVASLASNVRSVFHYLFPIYIHDTIPSSRNKLARQDKAAIMINQNDYDYDS